MSAWLRESALLVSRRSTLLLALLLLLISAGSLWMGMLGVSAERARQAEAASLQKANQLAYEKAHVGADAGDSGYYMFHLIQRPMLVEAALTASRIAQQNHLLRVRMLGIYGQVFETEPDHPERALIGGFDLAFVAMVLLPLFVYLLARDLPAEERERGRHGLIAALSGGGFRLWRLRLLLRYFLALLAIGLPILVFAAFASYSLDRTLILLTGVALYLAFWFLVIYGLSLVCLHRSELLLSATFLLIYVGSVWLLPSFVQSGIRNAYPIIDGAGIALAHREAVNTGWDIPKHETFERFFVNHPEYRNTPAVVGRFHWKWYYSFHQVADEAVAPKVALWRAAHLARDRAIRASTWLNPASALESLMVDLSGHSLQHALAHQDQVLAFHRELREFYCPLVFHEQLLTQAHLQRMPSFRPAETEPVGAQALLPLLTAMILLMALVVLAERRVS